MVQKSQIKKQARHSRTTHHIEPDSLTPTKTTDTQVFQEVVPADGSASEIYSKYSLVFPLFNT